MRTLRKIIQLIMVVLIIFILTITTRIKTFAISSLNANNRKVSNINLLKTIKQRI